MKKGRKLSLEHRRKIGLSNKGKTRSKEFRKKMSEIGKSRTGDKNSFFGKSHSKETKKKIGLKNKGKIPWQKRLGDNHPKVIAYIEKLKETGGKQKGGHKNLGKKAWNKGLTKEDERVMKYTKHLKGNKFGRGNKGKKNPLTTKRNLENNPMKDKEIRKKVGLKLKGMFALEKNPMWKGGLSFEPYTTNWTKALRKYIRERANYTCQLCGKVQKDKHRLFDVHHIDYNKKNCDPENLITLCMECHGKTNINRKKWIKKFMKLKEKI